MASPAPGRGFYIDRRPRKPDPPPSAPSRDDAMPGGPLGRLFEVKANGLVLGQFDERGAWCVRKGRSWSVTRGAPAHIRKLLTDEQKRLLRNAQLKARRQDLR